MKKGRTSRTRSQKIWATDDDGMFMVRMWVNRKAGFQRQENELEKARGSIRPMGKADKPEEEDAFKFDDEDPRPEDRSVVEEESEQARR